MGTDTWGRLLLFVAHPQKIHVQTDQNHKGTVWLRYELTRTKNTNFLWLSAFLFCMINFFFKGLDLDEDIEMGVCVKIPLKCCSTMIHDWDEQTATSAKWYPWKWTRKLTCSLCYQHSLQNLKHDIHWLWPEHSKTVRPQLYFKKHLTVSEAYKYTLKMQWLILESVENY